MTPHLDKIYRELQDLKTQMGKLTAMISVMTSSSVSKNVVAPKKKTQLWDDKHEQFAYGMAGDLGLGGSEWGLRSWADTVRKINTLDGHSLSEMLVVWGMAMSDDFWSGVIQSPTNFRKHYPRLKKLGEPKKKTRMGVKPQSLDSIKVYPVKQIG